MKKVIERMNQGVIEEQQARRAGGAPAQKDKRGKWLFRRASGNGNDKVASPAGEEEVEGEDIEMDDGAEPTNGSTEQASKEAPAQQQHQADVMVH